MQHAQTIAMARSLLADGRVAEVARMLEPLVETPYAATACASQALVRALLARTVLLRYGDLKQARDLLAPFADGSVSTTLPVEARAEVSLWLGWTHAFRDAQHDPAHALALFRSTEAMLARQWTPQPFVWLLLGRAYALTTIDEYRLADRALDEAEPWLAAHLDAQASLWYHLLRTLCAQVRGAYAEAHEHARHATAQAGAQDDVFAQGFVAAYEALVRLTDGSPTDDVTQAARRAEALLQRSGTSAHYPLVIALYVQTGALLRAGDLDEARDVLARAAQHTTSYGPADGLLWVRRAETALAAGDQQACRDAVDYLRSHVPLHQQRLLSSRIALVAAASAGAEGRMDAARAEIADAHRWAEEIGYAGLAALTGSVRDRLRHAGTSTDLRETVLAPLLVDDCLCADELEPGSAWPDDVIAASHPMRTVRIELMRLRNGHAPLLLTGETGTGKETLARALHRLSLRSDAPFVIVRCASAPPDQLDARLFGQSAAATNGDRGALRHAHGGLLFLDDVHALPSAVQTRLVRFLRHGDLFPSDAHQPEPVDVRLIAATHENLDALVRAGRLRADLAEYLSQTTLHVPRLRDRAHDIPLLVRHFLRTLRPPGSPMPSITDEALQVLLAYDWPGNVRQLRNEVERALVYVGAEPVPHITREVLSPALLAPAPMEPEPYDQILHAEQDLDTLLATTEKAIIERVLAAHNGQVTASAETLGLTRQGLYKKMKRLHIDSGRFQSGDAPTDGSLAQVH